MTLHNEVESIKSFYQFHTFGADYYPSHFMLAAEIIKRKPKTVLEFGAAWGKNYILLKSPLPDLKFTGIDININHAEIGKSKGINIICGDESKLKDIKSKSFDLVFTSSVLNHYPPTIIKDIIKELKRIGKTVILCECNTKEEWRWFKHDYIKLGFTDLGKEVYHESSNAYYRLYYA